MISTVNYVQTILAVNWDLCKSKIYGISLLQVRSLCIVSLVYKQFVIDSSNEMSPGICLRHKVSEGIGRA